MNSRVRAEMRRRRARDAQAAALKWAARHQALADHASDAGLMNMAIWHGNKATWWRNRASIVGNPEFYRPGRRRQGVGSTDTPLSPSGPFQ